MLINASFSFADFTIETKLSVQKQESYKKQIDSVYKNFEKKLSKLNEEKQISNIEKVIWKIEIILKNKISDKNNFVLSYLNYLLKEKLDFLQNNDEKLNLWEILKIEEKNNTADIKDKTQEQNIQKTVNCDFWYFNQNGVCLKKEEITSTINVNNQITTRSCYIENWQWQETFQNNSWGSCNVVSCNSSYHKEWNSCISNQQSCSIENGNWYKVWNWSWSTCNISSCSSWFENINWKCLKSCLSSEHREWDSCITNKISCDIENGQWEKEWKNWSYWYCRVKSCNQWYDVTINTNKCQQNFIDIKIIKNQTQISENNKKLWVFYINASWFFEIPENKLCFLDASNSDLKSVLTIRDDNWIWVLGGAYLKNNKICTWNIRDLNNRKFIIEVKDLDSSDIWKTPIFILDKESFEIRSQTSSESYFFNQINYIEE